MTKAQQLAEKLKQYINVEDGYNIEFVNDLAEAVEYLSQDEQEPVAWLITHHENQPVLTFNSSDYQSERFIKTPLYAHPPKRKPMSDDVIDRLRRTDLINVNCAYAAGLRLARLMEKKHEID